jgi:hypothetical protein
MSGPDDQADVPDSSEGEASDANTQLLSSFSQLNTGGNHASSAQPDSRAASPSSESDVQGWLQQYLTWSGPKRARAQQLFLKVNQLHHLVTLPASWRGQHRDFLSFLPDVLSVEILFYLGPQDLGNSLMVCRRWHERCTCGLAELIWESTFKAFWPMSNYLQNDFKRWTKTWFQVSSTSIHPSSERIPFFLSFAQTE